MRCFNLFLFSAILAASLAYAQAPQNTSSSDTTVNGLNTKVLNDLTDKLKNDPSKGRVTFFSNTDWKDGMQSITTFSGYIVDGKLAHQNERKFELKGDEGFELGGKDTAPGAVEEMMYAVGTCIAAAANANAALMGVKLTMLKVTLESDIDMHGLMALDPKVRPGVLEFRTKIQIAGNADEETLKKIAMAGYKFSPVSDTVRNGVSKAVPPVIEVVNTQNKS